jgi:LITAF-like zinc ribbon domain
MGLFSGNKKGSVTDSNDGDAYVDIENLPVAVAVVPDDNYQKQIIPASKQGAMNNTNQKNTRNNRIGRVVSMPMPSSVVFISRTPTIVPQCPVCMKTNIRTRTVTAPDWMTWVTVAVILVTFWPLCWVPLVTDSCRRTIHYCTTCHGEIGSIRPFKDCCVKHR